MGSIDLPIPDAAWPIIGIAAIIALLLWVRSRLGRLGRAIALLRDAFRIGLDWLSIIDKRTMRQDDAIATLEKRIAALEAKNGGA